MSYTPDEERIITDAFNDLCQSCNKICNSEADWDLIKKAFFLAKEAHSGVRRRSGEPYITHPIAVAKIVVDEVGLGVKSVVASLLHDVVEDTEYTVEDISTAFGPRVATMVDGLTKMAGVFNAETSEQAEYFRKVLLTLSDDIRVILIKIADRLHNMRTLGSMPPHKRIKITSETIYLFAPLAYRLGLYAIKTELENLCLKYQFPDTYEDIKSKMSVSEAERNSFIERFNAPIIQKLNENGVDYTISARVKSFYSIWRKMQVKQVPFEEVYDFFAIRIVFKPSPNIPERSQCWQIFSLITDIYTPKTDRIRDWVNEPKANGYEALHVTVMGPDGDWVEVQIRTERMDEIAERGFAAHWKYKKLSLSNDEDETDKWLKQIREALSQPTVNAVEFLDNFKMSIYTSEINVFTPKGETRKLPKDACVLDFAYEIHSKIGNKAIGAKVNHKIESIFTPLENGDQVQIITSDNAHPSVEWLKYVTTAKAKHNIQTYLKGVKDNNITRGIELFESKMKSYGIPLGARVFRKVLPAYGCTSKDEFYSKLGAGIIDLDNLEKILKQNSSNKITKFWSIQLVNPFKIFGVGNKKNRIDKSEDAAVTSPQIEIAECCNPIPGDDVIGYKDPESGVVSVHKTSCEVLTKLASQHGGNITTVKWSSHKAMSYLSVLNIKGIDRMGILMELSQIITGELNINIREMHIQSHDGIFEGSISIYVKDIKALNEIIKKVQNMKGVESVKRISNNEIG